MTTAEICQEIQAAIHTGAVYSRCANNTICSMSKKISLLHLTRNHICKLQLHGVTW